MKENPEATGNVNRGYKSPQLSRGEELEYSYATPEDNPRITHTHLTSGKNSKDSSGHELDYSYAKPGADSTYQDIDDVKQAHSYQSLKASDVARALPGGQLAHSED